MKWYKKVINRCMFPSCSEYPADLHHICPISKNGLDEYVNYFVCCKKHHNKAKLHSQSEVKEVELLTWKYMVELELFGFTSNDFPEKEFRSNVEAERTKLS